MPRVPDILIATSFKGETPKFTLNAVGARAVGGVAGIFDISVDGQKTFVSEIAKLDIRDRIVAHANGLRKIEINQLNSLLADMFKPAVP